MNTRPRHVLLAALALFVVAAAPAAAVQPQTQAQTAEQAQQCSFSEPTDVDPLLEAYNENRDAAPSFILNRVAGERVEFRVTGATSFTYTVAFDENARALNAQEGSQNPTLRLTTEAQTLCDAGRSDQPIKALVDAYDAGEIELEGTTTASKVTVTAVDIVVDVGRMLGVF